MEKKIKVLCDLGVGGERGRVFDKKYIVGALSSTDYKDPPKILKKIEKRLDRSNIIENALTDRQTDRQTDRIIVLGSIGNTDRQNRDNQRVISEKGLIYALKAHISKDQPLILRKYLSRTGH